MGPRRLEDTPRMERRRLRTLRRGDAAGLRTPRRGDTAGPRTLRHETPSAGGTTGTHGFGLVILVAFVLAASGAAAAAPTGPAWADDRVIVALGDSLTAGLGVAPDEAYPALLQARLAREGYPYRVINAGVSGDTTAGALRRVDWVLRARPSVTIVALGANDGLRGLSVEAMRVNLERIVERLRGGGAEVLLAGMRLPPNYGEFSRRHAEVFQTVARETGVALMPFLLDGVAADPRLNLPDGIHPNAAGHRVMADRIWPYLRPLLRK
jgi:acyl-CoA thioesterase I